eukprot:COSAG05_NODE_16046_length_354_cov_5.302428_1_plen_49_part_10
MCRLSLLTCVVVMGVRWQELVFQTVPPTHHKLLLNVLKMHDNSKKLKLK